VREDIAIPYTRLVRDAGISRGAIRNAIDEALKAKLIVCVKAGKPDSQIQFRSVGEYQLAWDDPDAPYTTDPTEFAGFFAGQGYRTPTPHAYFTAVIPTQTHATSKIVGAVIRHTVGYQTKHGGRRKETSLSYRYLQKYTRISSRETLSGGLRNAMRGGFVERIEVGQFTPGHHNSPSSRYSLKWLSNNDSEGTSSKTVPARQPVQKPYPDQFGNRTRTSPESVPGNQFGIRTPKKETQKETDKQQQKQPCVADEESLRCIELLTQQGITNKKARDVAVAVSAEQIERQIKWLDHRSIRANRSGFLIAACLGNFPEPEQLKQHRLGIESGGNEKWHRHDDASRAEQLKRFRERRDALLACWRLQSHQDRQRWQQRAMERAMDARVKRCIEFDALSDDTPHKFILDEMALELGLPPITDSLATPSDAPLLHDAAILTSVPTSTAQK
jgi:hypothetical protein